jgi:hypothetical protein
MEDSLKVFGGELPAGLSRREGLASLSLSCSTMNQGLVMDSEFCIIYHKCGLIFIHNPRNHCSSMTILVHRIYGILVRKELTAHDPYSNKKAPEVGIKGLKMG